MKDGKRRLVGVCRGVGVDGVWWKGRGLDRKRAKSGDIGQRKQKFDIREIEKEWIDRER
jgi:hypothetical protein